MTVQEIVEIIAKINTQANPKRRKPKNIRVTLNAWKSIFCNTVLGLLRWGNGNWFIEEFRIGLPNERGRIQCFLLNRVKRNWPKR